MTDLIVDRSLPTLNRETLDHLKRDLGGEIRKQLQKFLLRLPERLSAVSEASQTFSPEALVLAAHKLKGVTSTFGAERLADMARRLEMSGRNGSLAGCETFVAAILAEGENVRKIVTQIEKEEE